MAMLVYQRVVYLRKNQMYLKTNNQWEFQDPIYWRYLPYIRPM